MKNQSNSKIIAKLVLLNVALVTLAILTSCGSNADADARQVSSTGFVIKNPPMCFRHCTKDGTDPADSVISQKWDEDRSRWHGYSALNGLQ